MTLYDVSAPRRLAATAAATVAATAAYTLHTVHTICNTLHCTNRWSDDSARSHRRSTSVTGSDGGAARNKRERSPGYVSEADFERARFVCLFIHYATHSCDLQLYRVISCTL
jgi:hypothetical protein